MVALSMLLKRINRFLLLTSAIMCILVFCPSSFSNPINWDKKIYTFVREDIRKPALDPCMEIITHTGSAKGVMAINLVCFTFGNENLSNDARTATVSLMIASATTTTIKTIVNRKRPDGQDSPRWDSSFPSGHTTAAFATATAYGLENKKLLAPLLVGAGVVGFTRIWLGEHWTSDVLAGCIDWNSFWLCCL
jgi:undecaprenyl-diphosphatase